MKICSIGGITQDIFLWYQELEKRAEATEQNDCLSLRFGEKIDIEKKSLFLGGGAANTAINFAQLGHEAHIIAAYGNDEAGQYIVDSLQKHKVHAEALIQHPSAPSGTSYILYHQKHDRIILVHRGANAAIEMELFPFDALKNYDLLYITSMRQSEQLLSRIVAVAQSQQVPIAINPGSTQLQQGAQELCQILPAVSIMILNRSEAYTLFQALKKKDLVSTVQEKEKPCDHDKRFNLRLCPDDPQVLLTDFFKNMLKQGPSIVVVTDGACGVYVATKDRLWHHQAYTVPVVDTVGAGDAFGSTFVAVYFHTKDVTHALKAAMFQAASLIQVMGATNGLMDKEALHRALTTQTMEASLVQEEWVPF